jgi:uncharacterized protein
VSTASETAHRRRSRPSVAPFLPVFSLLAAGYAGLHWALVRLVAPLLPYGWTGPAIAGLGVSSILCLFLVRSKRNIFTRCYYILGVSWMGLLLIGLLVLVPRFALERATGLAVGGAATFVVTGGVAILAVVAAMRPRIREIEVSTGKAIASGEMRIVQLSDLHIGEINTPVHLAGIVARVNRLAPRVVAITGDLFDGGEHYPGMIEPLGKLAAGQVLFITGNHELYTGIDECIERVRALGITVLDDELVTVDGVQFAGLGFPSSASRTAAGRVLESFAARLDRSQPAVLLRHTPDGAGEAARAGFDVQLSGHTHNGQIWPFTLLVRLAFRAIMGVYRYGDLTLYVSPGTGTWGPPFRVGSRSEITLIRLRVRNGEG